MSTKEQYWKYSLIAIIIGLGIILFRQIAPFMGGLLGALTIYILVRKQMMYLSDKRKMKRSIAATLITAEAINVSGGKNEKENNCGNCDADRVISASGVQSRRK